MNETSTLGTFNVKEREDINLLDFLGGLYLSDRKKLSSYQQKIYTDVLRRKQIQQYALACNLGWYKLRTSTLVLYFHHERIQFHKNLLQEMIGLLDPYSSQIVHNNRDILTELLPYCEHE